MFELHGWWYRGGTSKCWLFGAAEISALAVDRHGLGAVLSAAFGAADPRHIDGVGGGTSTTSKAAVVGLSSRADVDLEYEFAQIGIGVDKVEFGSNCGNCATAIGLYAVTEGLVPVQGDVTPVRMWNTNSSSILVARVHTPGGVIPRDGVATVPGTKAGGVRVDLVFEQPAVGGPEGLFPTGVPRNVLDDAAGNRVAATLVNAGAPAALIRAADLGLTGTENLQRLAQAVPTLTRLRRAAALEMGLATAQDPVSHAIPKTGVVGAPRDYETTAGDVVRASEYDVAIRMLSMLAPHPAIGLTTAVAVAAALAPETTVSEAAAVARDGDSVTIRLGTPAGVVPARAQFTADGAVKSVTLQRAARRIARAQIDVPNAVS